MRQIVVKAARRGESLRHFCFLAILGQTTQYVKLQKLGNMVKRCLESEQFCNTLSAWKHSTYDKFFALKLSPQCISLFERVRNNWEDSIPNQLKGFGGLQKPPKTPSASKKRLPRFSVEHSTDTKIRIDSPLEGDSIGAWTENPVTMFWMRNLRFLFELEDRPAEVECVGDLG